MKKYTLIILSGFIASVITILACNQPSTEKNATAREELNYGGFESQIKWGEHLVIIGGCNDCHTPKKMSPMGPVLDTTLTLSGHPSQMPPPPIDRNMVES